ncbi:MAG: hypothetical protein ACU0BS_03215 [Hasllibacter sp.]
MLTIISDMLAHATLREPPRRSTPGLRTRDDRRLERERLYRIAELGGRFVPRRPGRLTFVETGPPRVGNARSPAREGRRAAAAKPRARRPIPMLSKVLRALRPARPFPRIDVRSLPVEPRRLMGIMDMNGRNPWRGL